MPGPYVVRTAPTSLNNGMTYVASYYPEGSDLKYVRPPFIRPNWTALGTTSIFPPFQASSTAFAANS